MIKNIQLRVSADPRGKIKSGMKSAEGLPKSIDYFNISKFPELIKAYGEKPSVLILFFPTHRITDFFDCNNILWNKTNTKTRQCDGETCFHRIAETVGGKKYAAGEESSCICKDLDANSKEDKKRMCGYTDYFKAYIATPQTGKVESPMCYLFETGSHNSGENVLSALEQILALNEGHLLGVPFILSVKMVAGRDAQTKFPIWTMTPFGLMSEIRKRSGFELPPTDLVPGLALPEAHQADIQNDNFSNIKNEVKSAFSRKRLTDINQIAVKLLKEDKLTQKQYDTIHDQMAIKWKEVE